jgi:hypothetical protein
MKGRSNLWKIVFTSWFLAVIPAIFIMLFLPSLGTRYKLLVEEADKESIHDIYSDLNSDSISEIIRPGKGVPYYYLVVADQNYRVYDQWNLMDNVDPVLSDTFTGNYDSDRFKEIYIFTYKEDSLFFNMNEFFEPSGTKLERVFITKIGVVNGTVTSIVRHAGFFDIDGDGKAELYFSIQTGFGLEPRRLYYFDIVRKELKTSSFTGVICQAPVMTDLDGDNKPEIFGLYGASGNYKIEPPYTDGSTWLMVFNENLKFEFPPVEFQGLTNMLEITAYKNIDLSGYLLSHYTGSADTTVLKPRIMLFTKDGILIRDRPYSDFGYIARPLLTVKHNSNNDRIFLLGTDLLELNDRLEVIKKIKSPFHSEFNYLWADLNFDSEPELLLYSEQEEKLVIYQASLHKMAEAKIKAYIWTLNTSVILSNNIEPKVYLSSSENAYFLKLIKNNFYLLGFLAYPGIYLLLVLFIELLNKINTLKVVQKESLNRRLITLQLQGIKSQLDPHFTFNTLNSVASLIYLEDRETAYDYMIKFTELLRGMLNDAERIYRSLGEELQFLTTYLELEKLRFGEKLRYRIEIGNGVDQKEQVPKLVLQTFAENAIKHGIMARAEGGMLKISADRENDYLKLTVEDNGIGRAAASGHSLSTGKGLKITGEFYEILNQINKRPIRHLITDLHDEKGTPAGTRVEVWVPVE